MIGAMIRARAVDDPSLSIANLQAAREVFGKAPPGMSSSMPVFEDPDFSHRNMLSFPPFIGDRNSVQAPRSLPERKRG
jgi:hypothetical protein